MATDTLRLYHNNSNIKTVAEFMEFNHIYETKDFKAKDFFEFNRGNIFSQLSVDQLLQLSKENGGKSVDDLTADDMKVDQTLPCPCTLAIKSKYANYSLAIRHTNFQFQDSTVRAFQTDEIRAVLSETDDDFNNKSAGERKRLHKFIPGCRVIGWFKSQNYYGKSKKNNKNGITNIYDSEQTFNDISGFIINMSTSVNAGGGTFQLSLPHLPLYQDGGLISDMDFREGKNLASKFISASTNEEMQTEGGSVYAKSEFDTMDYFNWLISPNDLLFISFHPLPDLVDDQLAGNSFDMIALVDSVSISKDANAQVSVQVSGRDLTKLITEDSSLYFPCSVTQVQSQKSIFDNTETTIKGGDADSVYTINKRGNEKLPRQPITGSLTVFAKEPNGFTIDSVLKTVVSNLVNMQVVPDYIFTSWGDRRTKFSNLTPVKDKK